MLDETFLRGKSKRSSAVILQAIADILGCSVKELLATPSVLQEDKTHQSLENLLKEKNANASLMGDCVTAIEDYLQKTKKTITTAQYLTCLRELYLHSLQKDPQKVNEDFAEWFIDLMGQ